MTRYSYRIDAGYPLRTGVEHVERRDALPPIPEAVAPTGRDRRRWAAWMASVAASQHTRTGAASAAYYQGIASSPPDPISDRLDSIEFTWPPGHSRASAEQIAREKFPGMPVADAPHEFLAGIVEQLAVDGRIPGWRRDDGSKLGKTAAELEGDDKPTTKERNEARARLMAFAPGEDGTATDHASHATRVDAEARNIARRNRR